MFNDYQILTFNLPTKYDCGGFIPSSYCDDLTLDITGSQYMAPANGFFAISKNATAANQFIQISNVCYLQTIYSTTSIVRIDICMPIYKGIISTIHYNAAGTTEYFRFIYPIGQPSIIKY